MVKRAISVALIAVLSFALAAPASAARGHGGFTRGTHAAGFHAGGFHGGFHGGFRGGFHHHGFFRFGCCFGPVIVGGVYPYYAYYPYPYPAYDTPAYDPTPASVYATSPVYAAPSIQRQVCYSGGCYYLQGDGVNVAYQWVWVPTAPAAPPGPPTN
jgi:hypothetical protein